MAFFATFLLPNHSSATPVVIALGHTTTISGSWTPGDDVQVYGNLVINPGATVYMAANKKITVEEDGRLLADGSFGAITFTSATSSHWLGIEILGNPLIPVQPGPGEADLLTVTHYTGRPYTTAQKGAAWMQYCTVENCNYGTVCGSINTSGSYNYLNIFNSTSGGGGSLLVWNSTYQHIDYVCIAFAPYNGGNASQIGYSHFYIDYNRNNDVGIGLFQVNTISIIYNSIQCRILSGSNINNINYGNYGVLAMSSGLSLGSNTIEGFDIGIEDMNTTTAYSQYISETDFINNGTDIWAQSAYHLLIYANGSSKTNTPPKLPSTVGDPVFALIGGDDFSLIQNTANVSNQVAPVLGLSIEQAIWFRYPCTNLGKTTQTNTINTYYDGIENSVGNYGMQFLCNTFTHTDQDIAVVAGGVGSPQGNPVLARANTFHAGCAGISQWAQNSGVRPVNYYYKTTGEPTCRNITVTSTTFGTTSCTSTSWLSSPEPVLKDSLSNTSTALAALPAYPYLMTSTQLDDYKSLSMTRDFLLSQVEQYYIDTAMYDSAFYIMSAYPCQRANIDKMNLLLTLDSAYSGFAGLESAISNGFSLCSDGSGHCDNIYYDSACSSEATTYYPMIINLKNHNYSDSIIGVYGSTLTGLAGGTSYYSGCAQTILQVQADSFFRKFIPHDSTYVPPLYPPTQMALDTSGEEKTSSIVQYSSSLDWKIYPNPASMVLYISSSEKAEQNEPMQYRIYSTVGTLMQTGFINPEAAMIDVASLAKGMYILKLSNGNGIKTFNFVRQ